MKKILYLLIPCLFLLPSSCTMIVKGLAKSVVKGYNNHTDMNVSAFQLIDEKGDKHTFKDLFEGKTVYLYMWKDKNDRPPGEKDKKFTALKERFHKYPDVVFADLYLGPDTTHGSYRLADQELSAKLISDLKLISPAPFIIGKDGKMLAYKGPKPTDNIVVDYVLFEARNGIDGTKSGKKLIRGVNSDQGFKTPALQAWYTDQFGKEYKSPVHFGISTTQ
nr:hypothetical protein [Pedobacter panaciterrae]